MNTKQRLCYIVVITYRSLGIKQLSTKQRELLIYNQQTDKLKNAISKRTPKGANLYLLKDSTMFLFSIVCQIEKYLNKRQPPSEFQLHYYKNLKHNLTT